jgi:hypothetical protein
MIYRQAHPKDASSNILAQPELVPSAEGLFSLRAVAQRPSVLVILATIPALINALLWFCRTDLVELGVRSDARVLNHATTATVKESDASMRMG